MDHKNKTGIIWRTLAILIVMALMLSVLPNAMAQEENPPQAESTTFTVPETTDDNHAAGETTAGILLYGQLNNLAFTAAISQDYGDTTNKWDTEVADDFVVPEADGIWNLKTIQLYGACEKGTCPAFTVNVKIYRGDGILPGELVYSAPYQAIYSDYGLYGTNINHYIINLTRPVSLSSGTYWISIQANMPSKYGNWGWLERSIQTGGWHVFRNPGGGWNEGCLTWCSGHPKYPDLMFELYGDSRGVTQVKVDINHYDAGRDIVEHGTKPLIYVSIQHTHSVVVVNVNTGNIEATIPVGLFPGDLAISPNDSEVYVGRPQGLDVINTKTNTVARSFDLPWTSSSLVYGGLGRLFTSSYQGLVIVNPSNGEIIKTVATTLISFLSISPDGSTLCASDGGSPSDIRCFDVRTDDPPPARINSNACDDINGLEISGDGTKIHAFCQGDIKIFDIETMEQIGQLDSGLTLDTALFAADGQTAIGANSSASWIISGPLHQSVRMLDSVPVRILHIGRNGRSVYATTYTPTAQQFLYIYKFSYFSDIYQGYWAQNWIERLYNAQITGGCKTNPLLYCPEKVVTRAQMAVFIGRGIHGSTFTPLDASGTVFGDIPSNHWAAAWIEQLAEDGVTGGCGDNNYCPDMVVTRAQMAVFLLRAMHGTDYVPPAPTGIFTDVPTDYWAAAWIEQLAAEGITSGCGDGKYCPYTPVNRAQMAVFLVRAFNLP